MLDALGLLLEAGKTIFDLLGKSNIRKDARRENVAQYLDEIAKTIHEAAQTFKAGDIPHGSCAVMEQLALALPKPSGILLEIPKRSTCKQNFCGHIT